MFEGILGSVYLSLIAFSTVFLILILLSLVMLSFKYIFVKEKKATSKKVVTETITKEEKGSSILLPEEREDTEEIAVVMAAIYNYLGAERPYYRINFIREISPDVKFWKRSYKLLRRR